MMGDSARYNSIVDGSVASRPRSNTLQSKSNKKLETLHSDLLEASLLYSKSENVPQNDELKAALEGLQRLQRDCIKRVRHLEGSVSGVLHRIPVEHVRSNGDLLADMPAKALELPDATVEYELESQILEFQICLENNLRCVNTSLRDLVRRKLRQEYVACQTESTSITAKEIGVQATEFMLVEEQIFAEKTLYSLPDLDEELRNFQITCETQTDLQMDHFAADTAVNKGWSRENVVVIYRNPNIASFLKPYVIGVGSVTLGALVVYKVVRWALTLPAHLAVPVAVPVPA